MSMKPTGDKGQRYEVSAFGYPIEQQWCVIGWTENVRYVDTVLIGIFVWHVYEART